jgi:hypothetical protein
MITVFFFENVAPVSLWKRFCRPFFPVGTRKILFFHTFPQDFQQETTAFSTVFRRFFHNLSEGENFSCVKTLFQFSPQGGGIYPQTFPHPVENFFQEL